MYKWQGGTARLSCNMLTKNSLEQSLHFLYSVTLQLSEIGHAFHPWQYACCVCECGIDAAPIHLQLSSTSKCRKKKETDLSVLILSEPGEFTQ